MAVHTRQGAAATLRSHRVSRGRSCLAGPCLGNCPLRPSEAPWPQETSHSRMQLGPRPLEAAAQLVLPGTAPASVAPVQRRRGGRHQQWQRTERRWQNAGPDAAEPAAGQQYYRLCSQVPRRAGGRCCLQRHLAFICVPSCRPLWLHVPFAASAALHAHICTPPSQAEGRSLLNYARPCR